MNENIKAFVKHNYITDSESRIKWQLYGAVICFLVLAWLAYFFGRTGNSAIDISLFVYSIFIIPTIVLLRHRANMVTDNTKFIKLQIIYNFIACISAQLSFAYLLYKFHGGYNAIIGIAYQILILSLTYYKSLKKHEKWIRTVAYKDYSEEVAKWDRWHTYIWHKDSYISVFIFGIMLLVGRLAKQGIMLLYVVVFTIPILITIDIVKYYMQLKYAKKYGMLDLLPSAPNEELTP